MTATIEPLELHASLFDKYWWIDARTSPDAPLIKVWDSKRLPQPISKNGAATLVESLIVNVDGEKGLMALKSKLKELDSWTHSQVID